MTEPVRKTPAEAAFDGAAELGRVIAAHRAARRQARKDERNARRRARYADTKHLRAATPAAPAASDPDDNWLMESCHCQVTPPPCLYCTTPRNEEE